MRSKIRQTGKDKYDHNYIGIQKKEKELMDTKNRLVFHQSCGDGEVNEMGKGDPNL